MELLLQLMFKKLLHTAIEINMYSFLPYQGLHFILFLSKELILQLVKKINSALWIIERKLYIPNINLFFHIEG